MSFVFIITFQFVNIISIRSFNNMIENRSLQGSDPKKYEQRSIIIIHMPLVIIIFVAWTNIPLKQFLYMTTSWKEGILCSYNGNFSRMSVFFHIVTMPFEVSSHGTNNIFHWRIISMIMYVAFIIASNLLCYNCNGHWCVGYGTVTLYY